MEAARTHLRHFERLRDSLGANPIFKMHFGCMAHGINELAKADDGNTANLDKELLIKAFDPSNVSVDVSKARRRAKSKNKRRVMNVKVGKLVLASEELPRKKVVNITGFALRSATPG